MAGKKQKKEIDLLPKEGKKSKHIPKDLTALVEVFGEERELLLFFLTWLKHDRNATKAYQEMHPGVSYGVAATLGSRLLKKVDIGIVLESYGLGTNKYFETLKEGLEATKLSGTGGMKLTMKGGKVTEVDHTDLEVPDFHARRKFHEALGKILGIEGKSGGDGPGVAVQINNFMESKKEEYGI